MIEIKSGVNELTPPEGSVREISKGEYEYFNGSEWIKCGEEYDQWHALILSTLNK